MTGKTARVAVLAATFVAVSLGLWQIAAGCASAEGDDSCPTAAPRCGDGCLDPGGNSLVSRRHRDTDRPSAVGSRRSTSMT
jgi:hypothetical protein